MSQLDVERPHHGPMSLSDTGVGFIVTDHRFTQVVKLCFSWDAFAMQLGHVSRVPGQEGLLLAAEIDRMAITDQALKGAMPSRQMRTYLASAQVHRVTTPDANDTLVHQRGACIA